MTDATELDEAAVRARLEAATPGPWEAHHRRDLDWLSSAMVDNESHEPGSTILLPGDEGNPIWSSCWPGRNARSDAEFIAHARTDLPAALDEITRLRAALDEAEAERDKAQRAAKTLGGIVEQNARMILDITGLHDWIDEDGDGDWGAIWENAYGLLPRLRAAESALAAVEALADEWRRDGRERGLAGMSLTRTEAARLLTAALATPTTPEETR